MQPTKEIIITERSHGDLQLARSFGLLSWDSHPVAISESRLSKEEQNLIFSVLDAKNDLQIPGLTVTGQPLCHTALLIDQKYREARYNFKDLFYKAGIDDYNHIQQLGKLTSVDVLQKYPLLKMEGFAGKIMEIFIGIFEAFFGLTTAKEDLVKELRRREGSIHRADGLVACTKEYQIRCREWKVLIESRCETVAENCLQLKKGGLKDKALIDELRQLDQYYTALTKTLLLVNKKTATVNTFINGL